ncbi:MAG: extracellular solute-binding protein [Streptosporangiales bacterium]|nr:extracellular solute-binding protein [Streptosporangiales bacterium]
MGKEDSMASRSPVQTTPQLSRRAFLGRTGGTVAAAALAGVGGPLAACSPPTEGGAGTTALDFVIWNYNVETVQSNIDKFQQKYPDIAVRLLDFSWNAYHETMVNRFNSTTPTDVAYDGGNWLPEFAKAGWVVPLSDHFDWAAGYRDKTYEFAWQDMSYGGKVYGLPYYADTISFLYNEKILSDAGIGNPPQTWEELTDQAKRLQRDGMERPLIIEVAQDLPTITEVFTSMVFGRGGDMFDENGQPLWTDASSAVAQQLEWLVNAATVDKILTHVPHETDVVRAMNTGRHAFTVLYNYNLAALNNKATSSRAGQYKLALMPGETHECYGFAKFYNMTKMAVDRGDEVVDACGTFIEYFAGETDGAYVVAKRWALDSGLGFGQKPLFDDPEVRSSLGQWMDLDLREEQLRLARAQRHTVWYGIWDEFFRREYVKALAGETDAADALGAAATRWNELRDQYGG